MKRKIKDFDSGKQVFPKLENVVKKTVLGIAGLAILAGLNSCGAAFEACKSYHCGTNYSCKADCETQSNGRLVCTPGCIYSPPSTSSSSNSGRDFGGASEGRDYGRGGSWSCPE